MKRAKATGAKRFLTALRLVVYGTLLSVVGYHAWRYDLVRLPPEGCSPLREFAPGTRLIVDRRGPRPGTGDAVLYRAPEGLLLGRIGPPPGPLEEDTGALWIQKDRDGCPGSDSRTLGVIPLSEVYGRVAGTLPW